MAAGIVKFLEAPEKAERDEKVMNLLIAGAPRRTIAQQLELSMAEVDAIHSRILGAVPADYNLRQLQLILERMDALVRAFYAAALRGDKSAAEIILKIERNRGALLGLYPLPTRDEPLEELKHAETTTEQFRRALNELKGKTVTIDAEPAP